MTIHSLSLIYIHLAVLLFGVSGLFGKFLALSPVMIVFSRTLIASLVLLPGEVRKPMRVSIGDLLPFILLGALLALHWVTFFLSIQVSTVAIGLLSFATFPVFVSFLEPLFFREKLSLSEILYGAVTFFGLCLVVPSFDLGSNMMQGALIGTFSSLTFAIISVLNRLLVKSHTANKIALLQNGFATLTLAPLLITSWQLPSLSELALLTVLGVFCTAGAHTLFIKSLVALRAQTASIIAALEPVYGMTFAYLILGETQSPRALLGAAIILGTTALATVRSRKTH